MNIRLKQFAFGLLVLLLLAGLAFAAIKVLGPVFIRLAYEDKLPGVFSGLLAGKEAHPLEHYQAHLRAVSHAVLPGIFGLAAAALALICAIAWALDVSVRLRVRVFSGATLALAVSALPPVAQRLLTTGPMVPEDRLRLWGLALALFAAGIALWRAPSLSAGWRKVILLVLLFGACEAGFRLVVSNFTPALKEALHVYGARTYFYKYVIEGHPFVQYTPRPGAVSETRLVISPESASGWQPHRQGHLHPKPAGTVRIATFGGSTTASGWPERMERFLNERGDSARYEVLNYGVGWYCSAHSVVNFALNAVHYDLDYIVIHDNWNDNSVRNVDPAVFRTDYSHCFTAFREPEIPDRAPIRASLLYRFARSRISPRPAWWNMASALFRAPPPDPGPRWQRTEELRPFQSNIQTMIDLATARGIRVILTTMPYAIKPGHHTAEKAPHVQQCNEILRELARREAGRILFLDLDEAFGPEMDAHFIDIGHVDGEADQRKAELVGALIRADTTTGRTTR